MKVTNKLIASLKEHASRKDGEERRFECPRCGRASRNEAPLEINTKTGKAHCLKCDLAFHVKLPSIVKRAIAKYHTYPSLDSPVGEVPRNLERIFIERNCDFDYTVQRYNVGWDGYRLCWPVGKGYWRRGIYTQQEPKVIRDETSEGLLGEHLLEKAKSYVVLTEGDWKAANIPLPWTGIALGGKTISKRQIDILRFYRPRQVVVALDGGVSSTPIMNKLKPYNMNERYITLSKGMGPDDIPRWELVDKLLEVSVDD